MLNYLSTFEENRLLLPKAVKLLSSNQKPTQKKEAKNTAQEEQLDQVQKPILITQRMQRNQGIEKARSYKKIVNNPRLKQRTKYKKAV